MNRKRAEAYEGEGYGALRYRLYCAAKKQIEKSLATGYYLEATTLIESIISDRLESRISFLKQTNTGFKNLGQLTRTIEPIETDALMVELIKEIDHWRERRNKALHELVKIEQGCAKESWNQRLAIVKLTAEEGYVLLKRVYNRVADLNPKHTARVFKL